MSLTVHHYTNGNIDQESLLFTARRLALKGTWLTPPFLRTLRLNFDAQWEYAISPPVFDAGKHTRRPLRDWGDLEQDGDEGKGLEELEEWVPWSREDLRSRVQEYRDVEMEEADTGFIVTDDDEEQPYDPSKRLVLDAHFVTPNDGSDTRSKHPSISPSTLRRNGVHPFRRLAERGESNAASTSSKPGLEGEGNLSFIGDADNEGFDEADTGFHIDEGEMEEDMSFGFVLSEATGISFTWGADVHKVDEDEMNTAFVDERPSAEDEEEDEACVALDLLLSSQESKEKDFNLPRRVSEALRGREDKAVFEHGWSAEADTGFHIEDHDEDYTDSQFFLPSIDHSRSNNEASTAHVEGDRNSSSVDGSFPDAPIEPPDESPDILMLDDDENEDEDANTGFVNFKANLDADEEDEEEDIDSRFILSDADIQYHNGSISEILDADDFTVQDVKEEEEGETENHVEGEYEEDRISEWVTVVDEDDSKVRDPNDDDYEYKEHPSRLIPIPQTIISKLLTSPVHTPQRFLEKYQSLSARVDSLGSGLGWIIPVTTPGGVVLVDGHEAPGLWTPRSLAAFWSFLCESLHKETGMGVAYDYFGGNGYFFKLYHDARLSVLLRGRLDEWVWRAGDEEGGVRMFQGLRLSLLDAVNEEVGVW
ncbi:uncharacterized protein BT62DRAFT_934151 [Guyanagaster necrorhizus]|uniref:Uncharacterized protein n=1 Tax=Guyanagaster necrorhizus TaxID=856835 RepID=A0A9P7VNL7_9AGAR|nr:uncharacterized protein BT62DRAFT_934151 [Guyanagaster necrorhizus MCA 3950]KAG7444508.1 hypothetical protein BT62DRAFT_934151 [Guyanagaster necrorhizus MCA 3950]